MTAEFDKLIAGGPGPVGDYCRRIKADGSSSTPMTQQQLKESGAGFWADMARQGGTVIGGGGGGGGGLLSGLSWTAGASTTLSVAGGRARCTATTSGTPARIIKGPFAIIGGHTYTFSGSVYGGTAPITYIRVDDTATISGAAFYANTVAAGGTQVLTGLTFTPVGSNPLSYFGIVIVPDTIGQWAEIDDLIDIMP